MFEKMIDLYLEGEGTRFRILITVFYLCCVILVTKYIVEALGYPYRDPKEINLAVVLHFILSGEFLMPLFCFMLYLGFSVLGSMLLYTTLMIVFVKLKWMGLNDDKMCQSIWSDFFKKGYGTWHEGQMIKGPNYDGLKEFMKSAFYDKFTYFSLYKLLAALFGNLLLLMLVFTPDKGSLISAMTFPMVFFYVTFALITVHFLRLQQFQGFYEEFIRHIESPLEHRIPDVTRYKTKLY